ncbi:MAG: 3-phosphoglycerate dehydrogenase [Ruminococcaceae bacterium]|nr:3-phosphoglycerate dehydrogenase [Oscillospiraceae bacterium]
MYNIQMLNKIAACGTDLLDKEKYNVALEVEKPDAIMVRSAAMHDMEFADNLLAIARAGAGVNNIPIDKCSDQGIVVFNTPGANANAVKELAVCALFLASRKIVDGINWAQGLKDSGDDVAKAVEKGKSAFVGPEIMGKKLGVIGLGAIGAMLANTALDLGMEVYGCDPYLTVEAAWSLSKGVKRATNEEIFEKCDYISIHVPSTPTTKGMINAETIATMKDGVRILNLARADLVNTTDLKAALETGKVASYVVDFPTEDVLGVPGIVTIPHLGASTPESEDNCAVMAAIELRDFIELGNIKNSVNYPNVTLPATGHVRLAILNKNVPSMLQQITDVIASENINIVNMANASKKDNAYTLVEIADDISDAAVAKLNAIEGVTKVRVIK